MIDPKALDSDEQVGQLHIGEMVRAEANLLAADWREMCRWDPLLPDESQPPVAPAVIEVIAEALDRPETLDAGQAASVADVMGVYAVSVGSVEEVVEQLVCLREAIQRRLLPLVPSEQVADSERRVQSVIDRAIGVTARRAVSRAHQEAFMDVSTGLLNRRAFERDIHRELGRAIRYERRFSLAVLALIEPSPEGGPPGAWTQDDRVVSLRLLGGFLRDVLRTGDAAYRATETRLAVLFPETGAEVVQVVLERVTAAGAPPFAWSVSSYPGDHLDDDLSLVALFGESLSEDCADTRSFTGSA